MGHILGRIDGHGAPLGSDTGRDGSGFWAADLTIPKPYQGGDVISDLGREKDDTGAHSNHSFYPRPSHDLDFD